MAEINPNPPGDPGPAPPATPTLVGLRADLEAVIARESLPGGLYAGRPELVLLARHRMAVAEAAGALEPAPKVDPLTQAQAIFDRDFALHYKVPDGLQQTVDEQVKFVAGLDEGARERHGTIAKLSLGDAFNSTLAAAKRELERVNPEGKAQILKVLPASLFLIRTLAAFGAHHAAWEKARPR